MEGRGSLLRADVCDLICNGACVRTVKFDKAVS